MRRSSRGTRCGTGTTLRSQNWQTVEDVLDDQSKRGQVLKLTEHEARKHSEQSNGVVTARVLFDGFNGFAVNRRTRIRDQERAPGAADFAPVMRETARIGEKTCALTADVAEAHRQIPNHPRDWHLLGGQIEAGGDVYINKRNIRSCLRLVLLVPRSHSTRPTGTVPLWKKRQQVASAKGR